MPKIDIDALPELSGSRYPAPYDQVCSARRWKRLGDAGGLTQFGVHLVTLGPGVWSSQRHWHAVEDEFIYILDGTLILVEDQGETVLGPGDAATFKGGVRNGHVLKNCSEAEARFLVVGGRIDQDWGEYSDIDLKFHPGRYSKGAGFSRKNGEPVG